MKEKIDFREIGEVRMGPRYYELTINGKVAKGRCFFRDNVFDADKKRMALTEYSYSPDEGGSVTSILWMIELESLRALVVSKMLNGVISPIRFEGPTLIYLKKPFGDVSREFERELTNILPSKLF
jgi:hypothetical protein